MANSELKPQKSGRFRNLLFGKKKTINSKKRVSCNCCVNCQRAKKDQIVQTNICADNKEEQKLPILNVNTYGDPKKIQKNGECPGKIFPLERRGCGFHMYFCIDNAGKSNLARNNKTKKVKNEKNRVENCLEIEKGPGSYVSENESLTETVKSHHESYRSQSPKYRKAYSNNLRGKELSETRSSDAIRPPESTRKKSKESEIGKQFDSSPRNHDENISGKGSSILRNRITSSHTVLVNSLLKEPTTIYLPPYSFPETQIYHTETEFKTETEPPKNVESDADEEAILKEYEELRRQNTKRRSTVKSRGGLARNSLMSLRKKRQSFVDNMVPEILSKLDHIEEKLSELEKVYDNRGKNITNIVGISCNSVKSALSMEVNNLDNKGELNKRTSFDTGPRKFDSYKIQPVLIKSCGEDVFVKAPESVSVVKKMKSKQGSKQLVYHNTQELDAHNITSQSLSKTRSIKSQNPKPATVPSAQPKEIANKPDPDMWRRISEELKF